MSRYKRYEVKDKKVVRKNRSCPRCGDGIFLAEHADRFSCGACAYTEWKKKPEKSE
jgi:small subunit ribosomal protein S27Ae